MVAVADVVAALGSGVLRTLVAAPGATVSDVVIAEPTDEATDLRGDLVVGAGVADASAALALIERAGASEAAGVVLRRGPARSRGVRTAARRAGVALLELDDSASLVHLVGVVQDIVDRAAAPDVARTDPGGEADLLGLADAAAALVDAPVTIEDRHLDALLLQEPGGGQTHHAGADDGDALGDGETGGGDGRHTSSVAAPPLGRLGLCA